MPVLNARQKHTAKFAVYALILIGVISLVAVYGPAFTNRASVFSGVNPPGTAACGSSAFAYGQQPSNCLAIGMNLQIHLQNAATTASLSGWTCQIVWNGGPTINGNSPGTTGMIGETVANTGSNGNCVTSATLYWSTWSLLLRICHQTTACGSSPFAQQEYVATLNFPGGTVPYYAGTQSPTTTWTQPVTVNILPMAGDIAASNTPVTSLVQLQNGTTIGTGLTCFLNQAKGTNPCYFGSGVFQSQITFQLTDTYSTSTFPYAAGYTDSTDPTLGKNEGLMSTNLQVEVKQTAGSHPIPTLATVTGATGFSNGPYTLPGSVPDVVYATPTLSTALTVNRQCGTCALSGGSVSFTFLFNAGPMTTSGDKASMTFNLYTYYSLTWVAGNGGSINSEAVTQMTQFVLTLQTP